MVPTRRLLSLAAQARRDSGLLKTLETGPPEVAFQQLRVHHPEFFSHLESYIERYGDRVMGELKLESITLRQDPRFLIQVIRSYLGRPDLDPAIQSRAEHQRRAAAEVKVAGRLGLLGRRRFEWVLARVRAGVKTRESLRLYRTRMFGLYRELFQALGQRLWEAGRLEQARGRLLSNPGRVGCLPSGALGGRRSGSGGPSTAG